MMSTCSKRNAQLRASGTSSRLHFPTLCSNPIRKIVDNIKKLSTATKTLIPLSLGDPAVFGNLHCPDVLVRAIVRNARYLPIEVAREAIAQRFGSRRAPLTMDMVIIASGCSGAIENALQGLLNPATISCSQSSDFHCIKRCANHIKLNAYFTISWYWEIDLNQIQSLVDDRTKGILINNPSNPCGRVYSKPQLEMDAKTCSNCARRAFAQGAGSSRTSDERATLGSSSKSARRSAGTRSCSPGVDDVHAKKRIGKFRCALRIVNIILSVKCIASLGNQSSKASEATRVTAFAAVLHVKPSSDWIRDNLDTTSTWDGFHSRRKDRHDDTIRDTRYSPATRPRFHGIRRSLHDAPVHKYSHPPPPPPPPPLLLLLLLLRPSSHPRSSFLSQRHRQMLSQVGRVESDAQHGVEHS
ncbi:hypothetical protein PsorP6_008537 [Peronosclerospora sorghi]|uniref:Uncharacterized protein n=1 Tax=Peronosclerospora sorghi TaxID=230839 RepID=A0ACC0W9F9_9STRA|nr:hypothetical protein PsorP6_008537 [Peronosclerospora sorghi]